MPKHDIIAVGTSAGGLEALKSLVSQLPADFAATVFIVWHMPPHMPSAMPQILGRYSALPVLSATDGRPVEPGTIYVATPDHHLALEAGPTASPSVRTPARMRVTHGPKENLFRPSVDVLFRSAARALGPRVIGVVLTGMLDDGASGLYAIKQNGGLAVVQDPVDALFPDMPINAMKAVPVDHAVSINDMGKLLTQLVRESDAAPLPQGDEAMSKQLDAEVRIALEDNAAQSGDAVLGQPSIYACPECHGVLTQIEEGPLLRFRCHTGHAFSINALLSGLTGSIEDALWNALRAIQESELLMSQMARHLRETGHYATAEVFTQKVFEAQQRAALVRQAVLANQVINADGIAAE